MVLIFKQTKKSFGIGDLLRSMFAFYCFCRENKIEYKVVFESPEYNKYFGCGSDLDIDQMLKDKEIKCVCYLIDKLSKNDWNMFLDLINPNDNNSSIVLVSNLCDFVSYNIMDKYRLDFLKFLDINFKSKMDNFVAIHVRCGDRYMSKVNVFSDHRLFPFDIAERVKEIVNDNSKEQILVFTDNSLIQYKFSSYSLNNCIEHSVFDTPNGICSSIEEFLIMMSAKKIIALSDSGFSKWAAYFGQIPLEIYLE